MQQFNQSLPMMLYRALDVVMPRFRAIFKQFGLTEQQWRVLRVLWEHEQIAFFALADFTLIPRPSLVGIIDRLSDAGMLERHRSEQDRRNVFIKVTPKGAALEAQVMPRVNQTYLELRASVDDRTWGRLLKGLETISSLESPPVEVKAASNQ